MLLHDLLLLFILLLTAISTKANIDERKYSIKDFVDSEEIGLLEVQVPDDIVYDLTGNGRLITNDELTGEYRTFRVQQDNDRIPYVRDPDTGHKYLVKSSAVDKEVDIYRIFEDAEGTPLVVDWADMTINRIKLNKYGEVELVSVKSHFETNKSNSFKA